MKKIHLLIRFTESLVDWRLDGFVIYRKAALQTKKEIGENIYH